MIRVIVALTLIIIINPCTETHAQAQDSIFLYNGQVLIGEIKYVQLGEIMIDDLDLVDQEVKMYKIKKLVTNRSFKIQTNSKEIYYGVIKEGPRAGWVTVLLDDGGSVDLDLVQINYVITLEKKFLKQLAGNLSAGFSFSKSSSVGQLNLSATVKYVAKLFEYQLDVSTLASIDSSKFSRDRENVGLFVAYSFKPAWFLAMSANYQRNLELSIARRFQFMTGAGNKIFVRRYWQLMGVSGVSFNQEKSTSGTISGLLVEIPAMLRFDFYKYRKPNIQITSTQTVYISVTQKGRFRYDSNTSFAWELVKNFHFSLTPYANYDNQPPQGSSNFDYGIAVSVGFKF